MRNISAKTKIIILLCAWLGLCALMFGYIFPLLNKANESVLDTQSKLLTNLSLLKAENESYKQSQTDLQKLSQQPIQPSDFFSRDVTFVNEIVDLDNISKENNVQMHFSGVSGTVGSAAKANTITPFALIPYSLSLDGNLSDILNFIKELENASFITNINTVNMSGADKNHINAPLSANFYLKK